MKKIYIYTVKLCNLKHTLYLGCFSSMENAMEFIEKYKSYSTNNEIISREYKYGFSVVVSLLDHSYIKEVKSE